MVYKKDLLKVDRGKCKYLLHLFKTGYRLLTCLGALLLVPFVLVGLIPLTLWKYSVILCRKLFYWKELVSSLTFHDMVFACDKFYEHPYSANVTFLVLEGPSSLETLRRNFLECVLLKPAAAPESSGAATTAGDKCKYQYRRLHEVPHRFGGFFFWKEIPINVEEHVREIQLGQRADLNGKGDNVAVSEWELNTFLGELMTRPFPQDGGLWELILMNHFEGDKSVLIFRMHHVLGDGYSFNRIIDEMIGLRSRYIVQNKQLNFRQRLQLYWRAPAWVLNFGLEELTMSNWSNKRKKNRSGVVSITTIPLHVIKSIRKAENCHFATIGLSLLGGALRRFYLEGHHPTELPHYIKIMHLLPKPNHPLDTMCNHWNAGSFKIPLKPSSALARLREAESYFEDFTGNNYDNLVGLQSQILSLVPVPLYDWFLSQNFGTSMAFTSLPAFEGPAKLWNQSILNMYKICGLQYQQTSVAGAVYTHNGQVAYTIFANRDIIPTQECASRLTKEYLHMELNELIAELQLNIASV